VSGFLESGAIVWDVNNDMLVREDIASGTVDSWFSDPGRGMQLLAVDGAIVWTYGPAPGAVQGGLLKVWRIGVGAPNAGQQIYSETYTGVPSLYGVNSHRGPMALDSHGVWFGSTTGLYLLDKGGPLRVNLRLDTWPLGKDESRGREGDRS
jgi:hypothetical protein